VSMTELLLINWAEFCGHGNLKFLVSKFLLIFKNLLLFDCSCSKSSNKVGLLYLQ
jgi:hypothetical protein